MNPREDTDIRLMHYIKQQRAKEADPPAATETAPDDPWCAQCGHAQTDHPRDGRCGAATEEGCDCQRFVAEAKGAPRKPEP